MNEDVSSLSTLVPVGGVLHYSIHYYMNDRCDTTVTTNIIAVVSLLPDELRIAAA